MNSETSGIPPSSESSSVTITIPTEISANVTKPSSSPNFVENVRAAAALSAAATRKPPPSRTSIVNHNPFNSTQAPLAAVPPPSSQPQSSSNPIVMERQARYGNPLPPPTHPPPTYRHAVQQLQPQHEIFEPHHEVLELSQGRHLLRPEDSNERSWRSCLCYFIVIVPILAVLITVAILFFSTSAIGQNDLKSIPPAYTTDAGGWFLSAAIVLYVIVGIVLRVFVRDGFEEIGICFMDRTYVTKVTIDLPNGPTELYKLQFMSSKPMQWPIKSIIFFWTLLITFTILDPTVDATDSKALKLARIPSVIAGYLLAMLLQRSVRLPCWITALAYCDECCCGGMEDQSSTLASSSSTTAANHHHHQQTPLTPEEERRLRSLDHPTNILTMTPAQLQELKSGNRRPLLSPEDEDMFNS